MFQNRFPSTERSVPKDGVRNPRGSAERLRGAAVSFQMTTASSNGGLAQNPVQRGRSAKVACNGTPEHDARTAEHDGSTNPHERGRCPRNGRLLRNNGTSGSLPRRYLQMSLGWRPRAETPGSQSAQNRPIHLSSPKPGHTTGGSGRRGERRTAEAGRSLSEQDADISMGSEAKRPCSPPGYVRQLI